MTLVVVFLVNAALSFALSLVLAATLGPDRFGRYALALSIALVVNTAVFEWLRLSTSRFYSERVRARDPGVRSTLDIAYLACGAAVTASTGAALALGLDLGLSVGLLAAAAACGIALGFCEYRLALARARFLEGPYVTVTFLRACLGFALAAGAAYAFADTTLVLVGTTLATILPIAVVAGILADPGARRASARGELLMTFARYGLPLVAASALYQLIPFVNRAVLASREGFVEAGYFSLASELVTRLFQNLGAALDLVLFQLAVRAEELHGREAAERQAIRNAGVVGAIVCPAAAGLLVVWPAFEALFVPAAFRGELAGTIHFIVPALAAFALVQYGLGPVFQLRRRTGPVVAAALVAVALNVALVGLRPDLAGPEGFAAAQCAALLAGLVTLGGIGAVCGARLPWRDLGLAGLAAAAMTLAIWPIREIGSPAVTLAIQVTAGVAIYGALAVLFDIAGARRLARAYLHRAATGGG